MTFFFTLLLNSTLEAIVAKGQGHKKNKNPHWIAVIVFTIKHFPHSFCY